MTARDEPQPEGRRKKSSGKGDSRPPRGRRRRGRGHGDRKSPRPEGGGPRERREGRRQTGKPGTERAAAPGIWKVFGREGQRPSRHGLLGLAILVVALVALAVTGVFIFLPFLTPLLLALVFTTVSYPLYETILGWIGARRRGIASGLTCALLVLLVFLPVTWVAWSLASHAREKEASVRALIREATDREAIETLAEGDFRAYWERVGPALAALKEEWSGEGDGTDGETRGPDDRGARDETQPAEGASGKEGDRSGASASEREGDRSGARSAAREGDGSGARSASGKDDLRSGARSGETRAGDGARGEELRIPLSGVDIVGLVRWVTRNLASLLVGVVGAVIGFVLLIFIMFYFFKDGPRLLDSLKKSIPLDEAYQNRVVETFQRVSRSLIRGSLATALAQGVVAGIGFSVVGLPAVFWGAMVGFCALVPIVGTALVTVPLILAFIFDGQLWWQGAYLVVLAALIAALDNVLRPFLVRGGLRVHPLWIFLSILGGVSCFGPLGLILGPMVVVFLGTFLALVTEKTQSVEASAGRSRDRAQPAAG